MTNVANEGNYMTWSFVICKITDKLAGDQSVDKMKKLKIGWTCKSDGRFYIYSEQIEGVTWET